MSIFISFGVIFLSALVHATLQLNVGGLLLLYHSSLKTHIPKKTRSLASNFILGSVFLTLLGIFSASFIILNFFGRDFETEIFSTIVGFLLVLAIVVWCAYYRIGHSTELWIPRSVSKFINTRAEKTESRVEAFSLGMLTCLAEFPFSILLIFVASESILSFSPIIQFFSILAYLLISVLPLLICRIFIRKGKTITEIQRWRVKNKVFLRVVSGAGFVILALFLLAFKIIGMPL